MAPLQDIPGAVSGVITTGAFTNPFEISLPSISIIEIGPLFSLLPAIVPSSRLIIKSLDELWPPPITATYLSSSNLPVELIGILNILGVDQVSPN